ncbi:LysR substrate-binding domain-containing protein [Pseudacidovorax sp. RU35E]|uniref:LysR substrate-binding domain-containing protein n=1 Tax=Pseudacidovorax sp. RU35E TaxID=1907403 RepID=UPI0009559594|nr:LysR substrate-binding domain-containing protein [Pseudacidovorax sp. RU35E]SIQ77363.1 LysR family transcriptional regulator, glycine cleavage system transcriptional activator [Pseudacidovorax sp. RU35E]
MSDLPPLQALRCFEAVARLGSVTRAAEALHVTHSAVSQQLRQLEALLGLALFERVGRGLRLSENGRLYALQVRAALGDIAQATRVLRVRPREGELVVSVIPSFGLHWLLPRLPRFSLRHPDERVRLQAGLDVQDLLRQGGADVAIRMGHGPWEGLSQQRLFDDQLLMVAAPHFRGGRLPATPAEVLGCPPVRSAESWSPWCEAVGLPEPPPLAGLWINDSNLTIEAVRLGQGVALERLSIVHGLLQRGELVALTEVRVPYPYPYWLVWPTTGARRAPPAAFAAWLAEEVTAYQAELADLPGGGVIPPVRPR